MRSHTATSSDHEARRTTAWAVITGFLAGGIVAVFAVTSSGQQPNYDIKELDRPERFDERMVKRMQSALRGYVTTRDPASYAERTFAIGFVQMYVPARITDPQAAGELSELTGTLVDSLKTAQRSRSPEAQRLAGWIFSGMKEVAEGNYHPPGRIAATMVLGRLDLGAPAPNQPPRIVPQVVTILLDLYRDEANDDGLRAAALQGLHRQISFGFNQLSEEVRGVVIAEMTKLLDSQPPDHRSAEAHAYLQRFAVDLLGLLQGADDKELASKLVSISTASDRPNLIAFHSAARIAGMKGALAGNVEAPALVLDKWSARVMRVFQAELDRLKSFDPPQVASKQPPAPRDVVRPATTAGTTPRPQAGGYEGYEEDGLGMEEDGGYGADEDDYGGEDGYGPGAAGAAKPQPPEVLASRRHLNHVLQQVHLGVTGSPKAGKPRQPGGLLAAVDDAEKAAINNWVSQIEGVITAMNDEFLEDRKKFMEAITEQLVVLEMLAGDQAHDPEPTPPMIDAEFDELPVTAVGASADGS